MKKRVLLLDDFLISNEIVAQNIRKLGYEVFCFQNPESALKLLKSQLFDLIITDYQMPQMNGIEFMKEVRKIENYSNIPIIVLSGIKNEAIKKEAYRENVSAWIEKPFNEEKLYTVMAYLLTDN